MKKFLVFAVLSMMSLILTSCEKEIEQYYVTYHVDGSSKKLYSGRGEGCNFYVNGMSVQLPYNLTIGPVPMGYKCSIDVKMTGNNTQAYYGVSIEVNGKVVARGGENIYASGYKWQEKTTHLEYVIGKNQPRY